MTSYKDFIRDYQQGLMDPKKIPEKPIDFPFEYLEAPQFVHEAQRTKTLWYYRLIEKDPPKEFSIIGNLAKKMFNINTILISLVDEQYRTSFSINFDTSQKFRKEDTFCGHTILRPTREVFLIEDVAKDWRFKDGPRAKAGVRFYAGSPLLSKGKGVNDADTDYAVGTICLLDSQPHDDFDEQKQESLNMLAELVVSHMEQYVNVLRLRDRDAMSSSLVFFNEQKAVEDPLLIAEDVIKKTLRVEHAKYIHRSAFNETHVIINGTRIPLTAVRWESDDFTKMAIVVPVVQNLGENAEPMYYLIAFTDNPKHVLDQQDVEYMLHLSRFMTTFIQTKVIEKANKAKTVFIESVSHELRTPLHGILSSVELMQEDINVSPSQRGLANMIQTSGKNLINIVNGLIDFNRWESGEIKIVKERFNVLDMQQDIADSLMISTSAECEVILESTIPLENTYVVADGNVMKQVLLNLCSNAVKFTSSGHVKISVTLSHNGDSEDDKNPGILQWLVEDTGKGISKEFVENGLFKPFHKEDEFTQGIGLGLAISKHIAESSGATLELLHTSKMGTTFAYNTPVDVTFEPHPTIAARWSYYSPLEETTTLQSVAEILEHYNIAQKVDKTNGKSTNVLHLFDYDNQDEDDIRGRLKDKAFKVVLCRPDVTSLISDDILTSPGVLVTSKPIGVNKSIDMIRQIEEKRSTVVQKLKSLNILIVDDNAVNRNMLAMYCKKRKIKYNTAVDGLDAFEKFKEGEYDVIFMDIQMPRCDGPTSVKMIREYEINSFHTLNRMCIIIMLTGLGTDDARENSFKVGANQFYTKPVSLKILDKVLEDMQ